jgi:hypothetical protein
LRFAALDAPQQQQNSRIPASRLLPLGFQIEVEGGSDAPFPRRVSPTAQINPRCFYVKPFFATGAVLSAHYLHFPVDILAQSVILDTTEEAGLMEMEMEQIVTKQTKLGEASVTVSGQELRIVIAGTIKGCWHLANVVIAPLPSPITGTNGAVNTHTLQRIFALTDAEADSVRTAVAAARVAFAATPQAKTAGLRSERHALAVTLSAAMDREAQHRERCYQADLGLHGMEPYRAAIDQAQAAIAAFDAAHPEVLAGLTSERKASVERFLATD